VLAARELCALLRSQGAEVVIALTHMRLPNDERLASLVPELDLVLGGHDHDRCVLRAEGSRRVPIVKSGTDFREFSEVILAVGEGECEGEPLFRLASVSRVEV